MGFLLGALKVIILLGTLVIIHEFGHFIVAKACGMKVLKFSIGFGPKILTKQGKETEYSVRALPLGGFVQLEGEDEDSEDPRAFQKKPAWQRLLVLMAGVTINVVFALLVYFCINASMNTYYTSKISSVPEDFLANQTGLEVGTEIVKMNHERIFNGYDVTRIISDAEEDEFLLEVRDPNGKKQEVTITIPKEEVGYIGVSFVENTVYSVLEGSVAEAAGLQANDTIVAMNGEQGKTIDEYLSIIQANPNQMVTMVVNRSGEELTLEMVPEAVERRSFPVEYEVVSQLGLGENLYYAAKETCYYLRANWIGICQLFSGRTENVEVQGIVGISQRISNTQRAVEFFYLMSAISLSLGIMNLLPIPGLDGGKILFTIIEMIRRKPINREVEGTLTLAGFGLLLLLAIVVTVGDVANLFS